MSKIHRLKILPKHFAGVMSGAKTAEFRINDRDFQIGDIVELKEYDTRGYSGWEVHARISDVTDVTEYIRCDYNNYYGYVMLSIKPYRIIKP